MKFYDAGLTILITVLIVSAIGTAVSYVYLGSSSPITKAGEEIVKDEAQLIIEKEVPGALQK